jgi:hypothetical protein
MFSLYGLAQLTVHTWKWLDQLVKEPTCFKKDCVPSLVDVVLTNKKSSCFNTLNLRTGVSDCHNLISTTAQQRSKITYRSYRTFDIDKFNNDIDQIKMENLDSVKCYICRTDFLFVNTTSTNDGTQSFFKTGWFFSQLI